MTTGGRRYRPVSPSPRRWPTCTLARHQHWTVPDIEYVLWAILIGLLITNTIGLHSIFRPGVLTYQFWLKAGIVTPG